MMEGRGSSMSDWRKAMNKCFVEEVSNPQKLEALAEHIVNGMIDKEILSTIFDAHRTVKTTNVLYEDYEVDESNLFLIPEVNDNFLGNELVTQPSMICPRCLRSHPVLKFTDYYCKCFGKGRNCSYETKRKISNTYKKNAYADMSDDEDDKVQGRSKRGKKRKVTNKKKNQTKNLKRPKPASKKKVK